MGKHKGYFWIARDQRENHEDARTELLCNCYYTVSRRKPSFGIYGETLGGIKGFDELCPKDFEQITGFRLEPGECVKVKLVRVS